MCNAVGQRTRRRGSSEPTSAHRQSTRSGMNSLLNPKLIFRRRFSHDIAASIPSFVNCVRSFHFVYTPLPLTNLSLVQNSDDAGAKKVEIHFNTKSHLDRKSSADTSPQDANPGTSVTPKLPDLTKELLHQWEFRNDGIPFREEDWNRLKKVGHYCWFCLNEATDSRVSQHRSQKAIPLVQFLRYKAEL